GSVKLLAAFALVVLAAAGVATAHASPGLRLGIADSGSAYFEAPDAFYPDLGELHAQLLRVQLHWGGVLGVAEGRPEDAADPADPSYDWSRYDAVVLEAADQGVGSVFSVFSKP